MPAVGPAAARTIGGVLQLDQPRSAAWRLEPALAASRYRCPLDHAELVGDGDGARCTRCGRRYARHGVVLDLDVVGSAEREAFDASHRGVAALDAAALAAGRALTQRLLAQAGVLAGGDLVAPRILDVACGDGPITLGLALHPQIRDAEILAFDHSPESLRVLAATLDGVATDCRIDLSAQDIDRLAFAPASFDLVIGNAVLHHFLAYERIVADLSALLAPGGRALFAEPFRSGHLLAALVYDLARATLDEPSGAPHLEFLMENVPQRARDAGDPSALAPLTDKHLFVEEDLVRLGHRLGCRVTFANLEPDDYYPQFATDLARAYGALDTPLAHAAIEVWTRVSDYLGDLLPRCFPHYRVIMLERA